MVAPAVVGSAAAAVVPGVVWRDSRGRSVPGPHSYSKPLCDSGGVVVVAVGSAAAVVGAAVDLVGVAPYSSSFYSHGRSGPVSHS